MICRCHAIALCVASIHWAPLRIRMLKGESVPLCVGLWTIKMLRCLGMGGDVDFDAPTDRDQPWGSVWLTWQRPCLLRSWNRILMSTMPSLYTPQRRLVKEPVSSTPLFFRFVIFVSSFISFSQCPCAVLGLPSQVQELCPDIPELNILMKEIGDLAESGARYTEMPHVIEVTLPMLCNYLPRWWERGLENFPEHEGQLCTEVTSEHLNQLLGSIMKIVVNNLGIDEASWMKRLAGEETSYCIIKVKMRRSGFCVIVGFSSRL